MLKFKAQQIQIYEKIVLTIELRIIDIFLPVKSIVDD